ncbi:MAG TPA: DUF5666 domain-containing protein [Rugosimonospora sp.]|nr:DUF5666 domain-containing protein [Rugosimonospora sp.]
MTTAYGRHSDDDTAELFQPRQEDGRGEVDLGSDPFADDLSDQLAERATKRYATRTTVILGALALLVVGFLAGAQVQKHWGTGTTAAGNGFGNLTQPRTGASGFPGFGGFGNQAGGNSSTGGSGSATTGTVKLVDGTTVYLQTADGNTVTVKTSGSTSVQVSQAGSLKDLKAGATVSVDGQTGSDGSVTATRITRTK